MINVFSIYSHIRNTFKQYAGKTVNEFCLRWNNKEKQFFLITIVINNTRQTICSNVILCPWWFFKSCSGNIYRQNTSFRPIEKRGLLETSTLRYDLLWSQHLRQCLIIHLQVLKFHIDQITDQCAFRVMIFGQQKFFSFIYSHIFIVFH